MMRRLIGPAIAGLLLAVPAAAATGCDDAATQAELSACSSEAAVKADDALNAAYKSLIEMLGPEDQERLREAQRAWIAFRDSECTFRTKSYADGSIYPMLKSNCFADVTAARTREIEAQINCGEGDLCPPHVGGGDPGKPLGLTTIGGDADQRACKDSDGDKRARVYVSQCTALSPTANPACDVNKTCGQLIDAIHEGCLAKGDDAPAFCAVYEGSD